MHPSTACSSSNDNFLNDKENNKYNKYYATQLVAVF